MTSRRVAAEVQISRVRDEIPVKQLRLQGVFHTNNKKTRLVNIQSRRRVSTQRMGTIRENPSFQPQPFKVLIFYAPENENTGLRLQRAERKQLLTNNPVG